MVFEMKSSSQESPPPSHLSGRKASTPATGQGQPSSEYSGLGTCFRRVGSSRGIGMGMGEGRKAAPCWSRGTLKVGAEEGSAEKSKKHLAWDKSVCVCVCVF